MYQVTARDGVTGKILDVVEASSGRWEQLLSAGGGGSVTIPLSPLRESGYDLFDIRRITDHWNVAYEIEHNGRPEYLGYIASRSYNRRSGDLRLSLLDAWGIFARRGAWDHSAEHVEKWSVTATATRAQHAANAIRRGRDTGPANPRMGIPITIPGFSTGTQVQRTSYGYHLKTIADEIEELMDEGLDVYLEPRRIENGDADWLMHAAMGWQSGKTHEYFVTADDSTVSDFTELSDGARITNNARRVGEGSEQDMLVRSNRDLESPYPLLDRITMSKQINDLDSLTFQANADLDQYWRPTAQWDLNVPTADGVRVGDLLRLHFSGDPWIEDGMHVRRVVKVAGSLGDDFVSVSCQPTGGA